MNHVQVITTLSLIYYVFLQEPVLQNGAKLRPAGIRTGSGGFWYLYHPCEEIMPTVSLILLHLNAALQRYTHAEQHWRRSSRSPPDHPVPHLPETGRVLDGAWSKPERWWWWPPEARQTSVTAPPSYGCRRVICCHFSGANICSHYITAGRPSTLSVLLYI